MKGERQLGHPYIAREDSAVRLQRIQLTDKLIDEGWLQDKLFAYPDLLPLDELDPTFRESISLCRELTVASGRIDNLYISPNGHLTIVEAKLYRNPQARREVVGQIIDYAKDLSHWTFTELDLAVRAANATPGTPGKGILELLTDAELTDENNEAYFINAVDRGLQRGEMLLLVVGDGIHESVEDMAEYIQVAPQLRFGLGLVELQLYALPNHTDYLIVPRVVTRTREIVRAVVHVNTPAGDSSVKVTAHVPAPTQEDTGYRTTISETQFFEDLGNSIGEREVTIARDILARAQDAGYVVEWKSSGFAVKYPDPNGGAVLISLLMISRDNWAYLMPTERQLEKIGMEGALGINYARRMAAVIPGAEPGVDAKSCLRRYARLGDLDECLSAVFEVVDWFVDRIDGE